MRQYHFLSADWTASSGDEPAWTVGETRTIEGDVSLCRRGYHASPSWLDALGYAPGPVACLVEVDPVEVDDTAGQRKVVSRTRTLVAGRDCSRELRLFAADCAERALQQEKAAGREPDPRSWAAVEAARAYARGEIDDDRLDAAWAAARAAARTAARTAARDAEIAWQSERLAWLLDSALGVS